MQFTTNTRNRIVTSITYQVHGWRYDSNGPHVRNRDRCPMSYTVIDIMYEQNNVMLYRVDVKKNTRRMENNDRKIVLNFTLSTETTIGY